jgi:hypothetical protein
VSGWTQLTGQVAFYGQTKWISTEIANFSGRQPACAARARPWVREASRRNFFCLHAQLAFVSTGDELARLLLLAYCTRIRERD